jgi:hypothetical protein
MARRAQGSVSGSSGGGSGAVAPPPGGAAKSAILSQLEGYGYRTEEEAFYALQAATMELSDLLGDHPHNLQAALSPNITRMSASDEQALENLPCTLGVPLGGPPPPPPSPAPVPPVAAGTSVNHIPNLPPIRNQDPRGTCVAFSSVAVMEHVLTVGGSYQELSEQFLYWNCKTNDGDPRPGTWLRFAFPLIRRDGVCLESTWAYQKLGCATEDCGPPPPTAIPEALTYRMRDQALPPNSIADIKAALASRCVAFSIPVFRSWYRSLEVRRTGRILMPVPNDVQERGGHAMTLVGYQDDPSPGLGGGEFILRNSWDTAWGSACVYGAGYGTIPYAYIARYCMEAYTVA